MLMMAYGKDAPTVRELGADARRRDFTKAELRCVSLVAVQDSDAFFVGKGLRV
jgi:hypothetical protein